MTTELDFLRAERDALTARITKLERLPAPREVRGWALRILFDGGDRVSFYNSPLIGDYERPSGPQFVRVRIIEVLEEPLAPNAEPG